MWLRQSTASQEILLGTFLDSADGNTAETGLTIANTDIKLWKEGATTEASKNSGGATHIASGRYYAVLDATDSNTLGKLEVNVHVAGALTVRREYMVVPANVYDSLILGTGTLSSNVTEWLGTAPATPTTAGIPEVDVTHVSGSAEDIFQGDDEANLVDLVWDETLTGATHNVPASAGRRLRSVGDATSGTVNDASATTTSFVSTLTGAHDGHFEDQTLFFTSGSLDGMSRIITTYISATKVVTFDEPLPVAPGNGDGFDINPVHVHTKSQIADIVWDEPTTGHTTAGTFGEQVKTDIDLILGDTNQLQSAHTSGDLGVDVDKINGVTITGDGDVTPFDVV